MLREAGETLRPGTLVRRTIATWGTLTSAVGVAFIFSLFSALGLQPAAAWASLAGMVGFLFGSLVLPLSPQRALTLGIAAGLAAALLGAACGGQQAGRSQEEGQKEQSTPSRRVIIAVAGNPHVAASKLNVSNSFIGTSQLERLVNSGLSVPDQEGVLLPQLAEALPQLNTDTWRIFPDGTMETAWRIKAGTRWHDGAALTADDVVFTAKVEQDRDLPMIRNAAYDSVASVEARGASTVVVRWTRPYVEADAMFSGMGSNGLPLPKHLLEQEYVDNRAGFTELSYWNVEFVGSGPFKIRQWAPGNHIVLEAFQDHVFGRPKLDVIEIRMLADTQAVMAGIRAGEVDLTMDAQSMPFPEARETAAQWAGGTMELSPGGVFTVLPQFAQPSPPVVADVQFRRALMYGMNRQEMADAVQGGQGEIAHTFLGPGQREYQEIERFVSRYEHDPGRAVQMIEGLGYTRGAGGGFSDSAGQSLSLDLQTAGTVMDQRVGGSVANQLQRIGLLADTLTTTVEGQPDRDLMVKLPALFLMRIDRNVSGFQSFRSPRVPLVRQTVPGNPGRYQSAELDRLIDRFLVTFPRDDRVQALGQIIRHETEQLPLMTLLFDPEATMISSRLRNVTPGELWNAHQWQIREDRS